MKKIQITLLIVCFAAGLQAQIVTRYKPGVNIIGICTSNNPAMTSSGHDVGYVSKSGMMITNKGWLCLEIGGVENGYYAIEVNLFKEGIKEFYVSPEILAPVVDVMKISSSNNKLVFVQELQGGVVNKIFIRAVDYNIQNAFYFKNAQVSKVNSK